MQPFEIVNILYESMNILPGIFNVPVLVQIYLLALQSLEEALGIGIVVWISLSAHTRVFPKTYPNIRN